MASEHEDQPRRPIEPLVSVVTESVALGYEAVELVLEGLRQSLRIQSGKPAPQRARSAPPSLAARPRSRGSSSRAAGRAGSGQLLGELAGVAAELLGRAEALALEISETAAARGAGPTEGPSVAELRVEATQGTEARAELSVINHASTALRDVELSATDLVGAKGATIEKSAIEFDPQHVSRVGPGRDSEVEIKITVPPTTPPGSYRGLVNGEPGEISAVLVLRVKAARKRAARPRS